MRKNLVLCGLAFTATAFIAPNMMSGASKPSLSYMTLRPAHAADTLPTEVKPAEVKPAEDQPKEATPEELAEAAYAALEMNCASCHGAGKRLNRAAAVDRNSHKKLVEEQSVVVPGKPNESLLYTLIVSKRMPPRKSAQQPTAEQIEAIRLWIEKGAPAPRVAPEG
jgi:mono/diheme cytochrome c family protein